MQLLGFLELVQQLGDLLVFEGDGFMEDVGLIVLFHI